MRRRVVIATLVGCAVSLQGINGFAATYSQPYDDAWAEHSQTNDVTGLATATASATASRDGTMTAEAVTRSKAPVGLLTGFPYVGKAEASSYGAILKGGTPGDTCGPLTATIEVTARTSALTSNGINAILATPSSATGKTTLVMNRWGSEEARLVVTSVGTYALTFNQGKCHPYYDQGHVWVGVKTSSQAIGNAEARVSISARVISIVTS